MKKRISIIVCFFAIAPIALHAQKTKPSFGIAAGTVFSTYHSFVDHKNYTSNTKNGFTAGVVSCFGLGQYFSFQPSLNFTQKGGKEYDNGSTLKTTFNYLELPLNIIYNTGAGGHGFFIGGGPCVSVAVSGRVKVSQPGMQDQSGNIKFDGKNNFKSFDGGINFLTGYMLGNGLLVQANYNFGLANIFNIEESTDKSTLRNNYFAIKLGYLFVK